MNMVNGIFNMEELQKISEGMSGKSAADVIYQNDLLSYNGVKELMNEVFKLSFRAFNGGGAYEVGQKITPQISWEIERKGNRVYPVSATVNGSTVGVAPDFNSFTCEEISEDTSYRVEVASGTQSVERTALYTFKPMKYWGVSDKTSIESSDILVMNQAFATSKAMEKTVFDCSGGKYPYYILPSDIADGVEVWINGFRNTDLQSVELEVINGFNVAKKYKVIRLNNIQTGILNVEFK